MLQATEIADLILKGFRRHFGLFQKITALAQQGFAQKNWLELQRISSERISYYDLRVNETLALLQQKLTGAELNECLWQQVKQQYQQYLLFHPQAELAETFYICKQHCLAFATMLRTVESSGGRQRRVCQQIFI